MNYCKNKIVGAIISILCIYILFFISVQWNAFSREFYGFQNQSLEISESMNMSESDYYKGIDALLSYIEGSKKNIHVEVELNGFEKQLFNDKEDAHMIDVKDLYQNAKTLFSISIFAFIALLSFFVYKNKRLAFYYLSESFTKVSIGVLFIFSFLLLYAIVDFHQFWNTFHGMFFSNDLWLLDPSVDNMIRMLPQDVFFSLVLRIVGSFILMYAIVLIGVRRAKSKGLWK